MSQCEACQHWQRRGGAILAARMDCTALEDDEQRVGPRIVAVLTTIMRAAAASSACPLVEPFTDEPDAYRAEDLPITQEPDHEHEAQRTIRPAVADPIRERSARNERPRAIRRSHRA